MLVSNNNCTCCNYSCKNKTWKIVILGMRGMTTSTSTKSHDKSNACDENNYLWSHLFTPIMNRNLTSMWKMTSDTTNQRVNFDSLTYFNWSFEVKFIKA